MAIRGLRVWLVVLSALTVIAIGGGLYVLNVVFSDNLTFEQGDPAYIFVVTSKTVREFPRFTAAGQTAKFTYSARDGTAPEQIIMTYSSKDTVEDLDREHRTYCERQGYVRVPGDSLILASRLGCDASDYRIEINFVQRKNATLVTVVFLER